MKKLIVFALIFAMLTIPFVGCTKTPAHFTGNWSFSKISKVQLLSVDMSEDDLNALMDFYSATTPEGIEANALAAFAADGTFAPCYLKFEKKNSYSYDPVGEREATWVFYQTGENTGFLSFYAELNAADGNPDPANNPDVVYDPESGTLSMTIRHTAFKVTVELTKQK